MATILVKHIGDGDYKVVRGGLVYQTSPYRPGAARRIAPLDVARGETATAAQICDWQSHGVEVREVA